MTTQLVKSLIDERVEDLAAAFSLPRETRVCDLPRPIKGAWHTPPSDFAGIADALLSMGYVMGAINWIRIPVRVNGTWHAEVRHG